MVAATRETLAAVGSEAAIDHVLADAGYWTPGNLSTAIGAEALIPPIPNKKRAKLARRGPIPATATISQRLERRLATKTGKALYKQRSVLVEPVFGQIKAARGITRFRRRGLDSARHEWQLIATTHNILKMWRAAALA
jgi:hypothetical protein